MPGAPVSIRAIPKSRILTIAVPSSYVVKNRFSGLRSRWMIPARWALSRGAAICRSQSTTCGGSTGAPRESCSRLLPSSKSITKKGTPPSSGATSASRIRTTCGLRILEAVRPSRLKRTIPPGDALGGAFINLSASKSPVNACSTQYTVPVEPLPRTLRGRYFPPMISGKLTGTTLGPMVDRAGWIVNVEPTHVSDETQMKRIRASAAILLGLSLFGNILVRPAFADPSPADRSVATQLFEEGRALLRQGNVAAACPKLEESERIDPGGGTLLNVALCPEQLGRKATAWVEFTE